MNSSGEWLVVIKRLNQTSGDSSLDYLLGNYTTHDGHHFDNINPVG
jgi:hypothetical protein